MLIKLKEAEDFWTFEGFGATAGAVAGVAGVAGVGQGANSGDFVPSAGAGLMLYPGKVYLGRVSVPAAM